jgi:hypothetical protein
MRAQRIKTGFRRIGTVGAVICGVPGLLGLVASVPAYYGLFSSIEVTSQAPPAPVLDPSDQIDQEIARRAKFNTFAEDLRRRKVTESTNQALFYAGIGAFGIGLALAFYACAWAIVSGFVGDENSS